MSQTSVELNVMYKLNWIYKLVGLIHVIRIISKFELYFKKVWMNCEI